MSMNFVMRGIPEDCELMRLAVAGAADVRHAMHEFMFETSYWQHYAAVRSYRHAHPELLELYLDAGNYRYGHVATFLERMLVPPVTASQRELIGLIQAGGRLLFDEPQYYPALIPASRVPEIANFLDTLDPALDDDEFRQLRDDLKAFYHRVAAVPGLAVVVAFM
jgi:hypothetical protein